MTYDGLHPNYLGEAWLGQRWFAALQHAMNDERQPLANKPYNSAAARHLSLILANRQLSIVKRQTASG